MEFDFWFFMSVFLFILFILICIPNINLEPNLSAQFCHAIMTKNSPYETKFFKYGTENLDLEEEADKLPFETFGMNRFVTLEDMDKHLEFYNKLKTRKRQELLQMPKSKTKLMINIGLDYLVKQGTKIDFEIKYKEFKDCQKIIDELDKKTQNYRKISDKTYLTPQKCKEISKHLDYICFKIIALNSDKHYVKILEDFTKCKNEVIKKTATWAFNHYKNKTN